MAIIHQRNNTNNPPTTNNINSNTIATAKVQGAVSDDQIQLMKRKFLRVNQEVVKQNVTLHDQVAKQRQEHHLILQENVRLKGKVVALENKLKESDNFLDETRKSISDRIEILEAIGLHIIDITKFLRLIGNGEESSNAALVNNQPVDSELETNVTDSTTLNTTKIMKSQKGGLGLGAIEEDDKSLLNLTDQVSDVSIVEEATRPSSSSSKRGKSSKSTSGHRYNETKI